MPQVSLSQTIKWLKSTILEYKPRKTITRVLEPFYIPRPIRYCMVACCHGMVSHGKSTTWRSPSLSRSNTWPLSSSWNTYAHLNLVFELWRYSHSDAVMTPAISPITGRLMEGGSVLFLPVQVQRTHPLSTIKQQLLVQRLKNNK